MEKKQADLLRHRVKLGAKADFHFAQLVEALRELRQVHADISKEVQQKEQSVSNVISNFQRITLERLEAAIEDRPSPSERSFEVMFTKDNIDIASRLEAPSRPKESSVDHARRIGLKIHKVEV